jgi:hypothetical protein
VNAPQIDAPQEDVGYVPEVRTVMYKGIPYVKVLDERGRPLLDLTCVDALNLAMLLIQEGGEGLDRRVARARRAARESP